MKYLALALCFFLLLGTAAESVYSATETPTPTPSPTLSSMQLGGLATIVPPPQCGTIFTPCGLMPFPYIQFPTLALPSPTLVNPNQAYAAAGTATPQPSNTPTPTGTWSTATPTRPAGLDLGPVQTLVDDLSGVSSTIVAQSTVTIEVSGTPQTIGGLAANLATNAPSVFGTIRGVVNATKSGTFQIISFIFLALMFVFLVYFATAFFPILMTVIRLVLQVIQTFKPF